MVLSLESEHISPSSSTFSVVFQRSFQILSYVLDSGPSTRYACSEGEGVGVMMVNSMVSGARILSLSSGPYSYWLCVHRQVA